MSMQLYNPDKPPQVILPPSDIDKLKDELVKIEDALKNISIDTDNQSTYDVLKTSLSVINEIIFSLDNSNDFFKIGGFKFLVQLLDCADHEVVAATAELIADLCQNNTFCQSKALEHNILPKLVSLLENQDMRLHSKALYALSSLCRHNEKSLKSLEETSIVPTLIKILNQPDEKLRARAAFFLTYLISFKTFRESFCSANIVEVLISLLRNDHDRSTENVLDALRNLVTKHVQSRAISKDKKYCLKEILEQKISFYDSQEEFEDSKVHCEKILALCFPDQ